MVRTLIADAHETGDEVAEDDRPSVLRAVDKCYRYDLCAVRLYTQLQFKCTHNYVCYRDNRANWIKITGCLYKPNCVVVLGVEDDYPV